MIKRKRLQSDLNDTIEIVCHFIYFQRISTLSFFHAMITLKLSDFIIIIQRGRCTTSYDFVFLIFYLHFFFSLLFVVIHTHFVVIISFDKTNHESVTL